LELTSEPKIIAFICEWGSYANNNTVDVGHFQDTSNVRIIRTMCSGQVEPDVILKALRNGVDGVLMVGCRPGECHYVSGNEMAETRIRSTHHTLDMLGIEPSRVGLEWISVSDKPKLAQVITDFVEEIRKLGPNNLGARTNTDAANPNPATKEKREQEIGLEYCIECNKCASSCPITRVDSTYSPSVDVFSKSIVPREDGTYLPRAYDCLTCGLCSQRCPSGVKYEELIKAERSKARAAGDVGNCAHGETLELISDFQTKSDLRQRRLGWVSDGLEISSKGEVLYFVGCLPYFEHALFNDAPAESELSKIGHGILDISRSTIALLNRAGIAPTVLPDERCCGHDSLWTGDEEKFRKLASINIENIDCKMINEAGGGGVRGRVQDPQDGLPKVLRGL